MNYSTYRFTLDIHKTKSQVSMSVPYMDTGIQLLISLTDGGKPYLIDPGCTAVFYGKKADGTTLVTDCKIIDGVRINYIFTDQTTTCVGVVDCEIRLYSKEGLLITTPCFIISVEPRAVNDEDIILSNSERDAVDRLFESESQREEAEEARAEAETARAEAETARALAETVREEAEQLRKDAEQKREQTFKTVFIRYSSNADGTDYTEEWSEGQNYIGVATAQEEPADKDGYEWILMKGEKGDTGTSAYEYAHDGGYLGSEEQFAKDLGEVPITAATALRIAKGATQAKSFNNYHEMVSALLAAAEEAYLVGQNIYVKTTGVPDFWISDMIPGDYIMYPFTNDNDLISDVVSFEGSLRIGYYEISFLETQKVDHSEYLKRTEAPNLITQALSDAKASGEFDGEVGYGIYYARAIEPNAPDGEWFKLKDISLNGRTLQIGDFILFEDALYKVSVIYTDNCETVKIISLKGKDGKTPVKGTDYFTPEDIYEIVNAVYAKVADGNGVAY